MKRVGLVRTLKGVILFLAAMAALCYLVIFPDYIREMGTEDANVTWLVTPGIAAVSLSAIPIIIALVLFWMICTEVGRDNSFCRKNARYLSGISWRERVGCVICRRDAAFVIFSSLATTRKYCNTRSSISTCLLKRFLLSYQLPSENESAVL